MDTSRNNKDFLISELRKIYEKDEEILNIISLVPEAYKREELLMFMKEMSICRPSQVESMIYLINRNKTETDKIFIKKLFEIWNNSDFVLGAFLPLSEEGKKQVINFIDINEGVPNDELRESLMEFIINIMHSQ